MQYTFENLPKLQDRGLRSMSSKYQMWLTHNSGKSKMRFPFLPDTIMVKDGSMNKSVNISGLGEITVKQDRPTAFTSPCTALPRGTGQNTRQPANPEKKDYQMEEQ
jgi:hypothetical protein